MKKNIDKKKSKKQERQDLISEVYDLENELGYIEYRIPTLLKSIRDLKPTKAELEDGLQEMFDSYL